jgi:hypothetical protein
MRRDECAPGVQQQKLPVLRVQAAVSTINDNVGLPKWHPSDNRLTCCWRAGQRVVSLIGCASMPVINMKARYALLCALTVLGIFAVVNSAPAQGTAFTYQGCLNDAGGPANGNYDLQFTLYNSATNGGSLGTPFTDPATGVTNGLFTVTLDFGTGIFAGQPLWLEIGVRTNGGQNSFSTLSPRQPLTSAPYAITAANLSGTLPVSQLTGTWPASQLSGTIPVASIVGAQPANMNLATNLTYTNYDDAEQALLPVIIGHTYVYCPTQVGGIYDGSYILAIAGTNYPDANASFIDLSGGLSLLSPFQTNQVFVATQNTVTFIYQSLTGGPVTDSLFDLANLTINGTVNGTGQFNGNLQGVFSGIITNSTITNSTLAGNAQGGAVTNLDYSINNLNDNGGSIPNIIARLATNNPAGGVIYIPSGSPSGGFTTGTPIAIASDFGGTGNVSPAVQFRIQGNGSALSTFGFTGAHTNMFDQYNGAFGLPAIDLRGVGFLAQILSGGVGDFGYVSAPGASGDSYWNDVSFNQFVIGACSVASDSEYENMHFLNCGVGFILAPYSDIDSFNLGYSYNNTNAVLEVDSRALRFHGDVSGANNIGVLIGGGGDDELHIAGEATTNCTIAIGYPNNWPFTVTNMDPYNTQYAGTQMGNDVSINPIYAGFGYGLRPSVNRTDQFAYNNSAFMKVWNNGFFGGAELECETLSGEVGVISYTAAGDVAPYSFDFFSTGGGTNLFVFSDGTTIPSEDGYKVGVNLPELQFTKNVLEYSRDTNGNLYAAGNITAAGALNASAAQIGSLTVTGAGANSLLGTDAGGNVTGIIIGGGLTLSGGTLSLSRFEGSGLVAGTSVNTYTADHTATARDSTILVNGSGLTITLPDASALGAGRSYIIKLIAGSTATVVTTGSQTIDGTAGYTLSARNKYVMVQSDGAQWWVLGNN